MSWRNKALEISRFGRIAFAFGLAGLCAGCFQPLYGSSLAGRRRGSVKDKLASVQVQEIEAPNGTADRAARRRGAQRADFRFRPAARAKPCRRPMR